MRTFLAHIKVVIILLISLIAQDYLKAQSNPLIIDFDQSYDNVINVSCKEIRLKPGFRYAADFGVSMRTYIDPYSMCDINYENGFPGGNPSTLNPNFEVGTTPGSFD